LHSEVTAHRIRRNVVELNSQQAQSLGVDEQWIEWRTRESSLKGACVSGTGGRATRESNRGVRVGMVKIELELERIVFTDVR